MMYDCAETYRRLQDYLDRELTPDEIVLVEAHLERCGMCAEEFRFEASVLHHVRTRVGADAPPEDLFARVSAALDEA